MDLEEWELLPGKDGLLDLDDDDDDDGVMKIIHPKKKNVLDLDYFIYPSPDPDKTIQPISTTQLAQVPISWEPVIGDKGTEETQVEKEITKFPCFEADQAPVSQLSFKKTNDNEFADMKMDSPRSDSCRTTGDFAQIDHTTSFKFEESMENNMESPRKNEDGEESDGKSNNIWKLSMNGVGAVCSFGVAAAATLCIIFFGSNQKKNNQDNNQRLRFQFYTDDKRIKQVVQLQHAAKLNEAISAVRGVPVTRAHLSFGGHYNGLINHSR